MNHLLEFFGRLHPMLVHLPIGILILVVALMFFFEFKKKKVSRSVLNFSLGAGALSAIASALTGYLLSLTGEYDETSLSRHKWLGISVALISFVLWYLFSSGRVKRRSLKLFSVLLLVLLTGAGHLGASLTHGSDYLTEPLSAMAKGEQQAINLASMDLNKTPFYGDVIKPIFDKRCTSCHGEGKQKGKLRLDKPEYIVNGGKSGLVIEPGKQDEGELLYRIHLPLKDKDHMPPKEKPQLTEQELRLIRLWIESGADFNRTIGSFFTKLKLDSALGHQEGVIDVPANEPSSPDWNLVKVLIKKGVSITAVAQGSNFLSVSLISTPGEASSLLPALIPLRQHVIWIKLSDCEVGDGAIVMLKQFNKLTRLSLDNTKITDVGLAEVASLPELVSLNLKGTPVTKDGIRKLSKLNKLRDLYLYQTKIAIADHQELMSLLKNTRIDFGDYHVPTLVTDTTEVKPAKK
jgi:uncharacterized membrane protein